MCHKCHCGSMELSADNQPDKQVDHNSTEHTCVPVHTHNYTSSMHGQTHLNRGLDACGCGMSTHALSLKNRSDESRQSFMSTKPIFIFLLVYLPANWVRPPTRLTAECLSTCCIGSAAHLVEGAGSIPHHHQTLL